MRAPGGNPRPLAGLFQLPWRQLPMTVFKLIPAHIGLGSQPRFRLFLPIPSILARTVRDQVWRDGLYGGNLKSNFVRNQPSRPLTNAASEAAKQFWVWKALSAVSGSRIKYSSPFFDTM
jgi:hypothetical protein